MHRHELSDSQFAHLDPFLPDPRHHGKAGRPWLPHRTIVNGILWILHTGAPRAISPNPMVNGILSMSASNAGDRMAPGPAFCRPCWIKRTIKDASTMICGASTVPLSVRLVPQVALATITIIVLVWTKVCRRKLKSHKIMRWATPVAVLPPRSTCCATVWVPSWVSM